MSVKELIEILAKVKDKDQKVLIKCWKEGIGICFLSVESVFQAEIYYSKEKNDYFRY